MKLMLIAILFLCLPAQALQQVSVHDQNRVEVSISNTDVNRIALVSDRVKAIYGGQDQAHFTTDEETGQVFITTKRSDVFGISLITEKGFTIDLNLKPSDITSETILLNVNADEREMETLTTAALKKEGPRRVFKNCKYLTTYFGLKYKATVFLYTHQDGVVTEDMFSVGKVFIENRHLKPKSTTRVIIFEPYV